MEADLSNRIGEAAERFVPGQGRGELMEAEHLARYWWVGGLAGGRRVLDAGCGVGYGSAMLADAGASDVVGIDVASDAIAAAAEANQQVEFVIGDVHALPFEDSSFDLVVCFEVIEHVTEQDAVIAELARVLMPDGVLAISSPNRGVYPAGNPHHLHEYTPDELMAALRGHLEHVELRRQHDWLASAVLDDEQVAQERVADLGIAVAKSLGLRPASETYTIALASRAPLPSVHSRIVMAGADELREALVLGADARGGAMERDQLRADVASMQRVEAQLRDEQAVLLAQLQETQASLRRIHSSALWRLSKPLRGLAQLRRYRA
jgi:SAM-dependent methyltransferase